MLSCHTVLYMLLECEYGPLIDLIGMSQLNNISICLTTYLNYLSIIWPISMSCRAQIDVFFSMECLIETNLFLMNFVLVEINRLQKQQTNLASS